MRLLSPQSLDDLHRFAAFAQDVHRDNPCWVPQDGHHVADNLSGRFAGAALTQRLPFRALGERGEILATVCAENLEPFNRLSRQS